MPTLIEQAVDSQRHEMEAKQIGPQLVVESGGAVVSGDSPRLHRVIANLVTNAIKLTLPGGRIVVRIVAESAGRGPWLVAEAAKRSSASGSRSGSGRMELEAAW